MKNRQLEGEIHRMRLIEGDKVQEISTMKRSYEAQLTSMSQRIEDMDQIIESKTKITDEQKDSIQVLKQNLDNKCREHQGLLKELEDCHEELDELRQLDTQSSKDLIQEV